MKDPKNDVKKVGHIKDDLPVPDPVKSPDELGNLADPEKKKERKVRVTKAMKTAAEVQKRKESLDFAKQAIPQGLTALEELLLNRLHDKDLIKDLKLTTGEKTIFTESLVLVAEKRNWFKAEDTPEIALSIAILSIVGARIEIIKKYRDKKNEENIQPIKSNK
jgi:hypothetical protein